ncbi:S4 domain-containing protein YaaA [Companilactobacillus kedongensis]|uniref:S4 domain-containing protein YaaA n=1 Tax=Companilactobacillus kedongensis TaxID=2486004 RepID=UPI000F7B1E4C|nr:S4 domain-containing protein YaaA [Companilactobacillus kedongensis]
MSQKIKIETEFITLGQFLKDVGIISTGGQAKWYLKDNAVQLNGALEDRRGKKLHKGDVLIIDKESYEIE